MHISIQSLFRGPFDGWVDGEKDDKEEEAVEAAEDGRAAVLRVLLGT